SHLHAVGPDCRSGTGGKPESNGWHPVRSRVFSYAQSAGASAERAGRVAHRTSPPGPHRIAHSCEPTPAPRRVGCRRWRPVVCYTSRTSGSSRLGHWLQGRVLWLPVVRRHLVVSTLCVWGWGGDCLWGSSPRQGTLVSGALLAGYRCIRAGSVGQASSGCSPCGGVGPGCLGLATDLASPETCIAGVAGARGAVGARHASPGPA